MLSEMLLGLQTSSRILAKVKTAFCLEPCSVYIPNLGKITHHSVKTSPPGGQITSPHTDLEISEIAAI